MFFRETFAPIMAPAYMIDRVFAREIVAPVWVLVAEAPVLRRPAFELDVVANTRVLYRLAFIWIQVTHTVVQER